VSLEHLVAGAGTRYPMLATAVERHLEWARDFAGAGDVDLAVDAIRDARAALGELHVRDIPRGVGERSFVTMSRVTDRHVSSALRDLAEQSAKAADGGGSEADLLDAYEALRRRGEMLARDHGWASSDEFADLFPSPQALRQIERLDDAFGAQPVPALAPGRGMSRRLSEALKHLSAWATGVRLAYETREDEGGTDA
jgi:hypothetical protein